MPARMLQQPATRSVFGADRKRMLLTRVGVQVEQLFLMRSHPEDQLEALFAHTQNAWRQSRFRAVRVNALGGINDGGLLPLFPKTHGPPATRTLKTSWNRTVDGAQQRRRNIHQADGTLRAYRLD